jgi:hypothetical protein
MADEFSVDTSWLDELGDRMEGLSTKDLPRIERAGLRSVANVVKPELESVTPVASQMPTSLSTALPIGKLKESVRSRVLEPRGDLGRAAVVDFGRYSHVAHFVDAGHALVKGGYSKDAGDGKRRGPGRIVGNVQAYPFVRAVQDSVEKEAEEAMVSGADAEVDRVLNGR